MLGGFSSDSRFVYVLCSAYYKLSLRVKLNQGLLLDSAVVPKVKVRILVRSLIEEVISNPGCNSSRLFWIKTFTFANEFLEQTQSGFDAETKSREQLKKDLMRTGFSAFREETAKTTDSLCITAHDERIRKRS